jgi:hypothetical protein
MEDLMDDPEVRAWMEDARANLIPMIADADASISLVPSTLDDVKHAVELGLSIMMDKPIIAVALDGRPVPEKMLKVADAVVRMTTAEMRTPAGRAKIQAAFEQVVPEQN